MPLLVLLLLAGCGGSSKQSAGKRSSLVVLVNAPFSRTPYLGRAIENGARLAAREVNANGIRVGGTTYDLKIETLDSGLSPARAVSNVRRAVGRHAVAIVDEGTGIDASWRIAEKSGVPIGVVFEGGNQVIDPVSATERLPRRPDRSRDRVQARRVPDPERPAIALIHDDSDYGAAGEDALRSAFSRNQSSIAGDDSVPADALDVAPQVLRARRAHATALLVWGRPATIAAAITAARSAGWNVPFYTPPTGADPFVRQQLADHPAWVDGLTFAGGRLTAEVGTGPFQTFEQKLESAYGVDRVGVKTKAGDEVIQPPETAMYAYDFVNLVAAAVLQAGSTDPAQVTEALNEVTVQGANGDSARLQPAQPRRRRRRRRLLRALPRHDVRAGPGRSALEDACRRSLRFDDACARSDWRSSRSPPQRPRQRRSRASPPSRRRSRRSPRRRRSARARRRPRRACATDVDATTRVRIAVDARRHAVRRHRHAAARRLTAGRLLLHDRRAADRRRAAHTARSRRRGFAPQRSSGPGSTPASGCSRRARRSTRRGRGLVAASRLDRRRQGDARERDGDHDDRLRGRRAQAAARGRSSPGSGARPGPAVRRRAVGTRDVAARADDGARDRAAARDRDDRVARHVDVTVGTDRVQLPGRAPAALGLGAAPVRRSAPARLSGRELLDVAVRRFARVRPRTPVRLVPRQPRPERVERLDLQLRLGDPAGARRQRSPSRRAGATRSASLLWACGGLAALAGGALAWSRA